MDDSVLCSGGSCRAHCYSFVVRVTDMWETESCRYGSSLLSLSFVTHLNCTWRRMVREEWREVQRNNIEGGVDSSTGSSSSQNTSEVLLRVKSGCTSFKHPNVIYTRTELIRFYRMHLDPNR